MAKTEEKAETINPADVELEIRRIHSVAEAGVEKLVKGIRGLLAENAELRAEIERLTKKAK